MLDNPPRTRQSPSGPGRHSLGPGRHPPGPGRHPPGPDRDPCPPPLQPGRHPPGTRQAAPLGPGRYPPPPPPPRAEHTVRYGQRAGGMHPTGMQSCLLDQIWENIDSRQAAGGQCKVQDCYAWRIVINDRL